MRRFSLKEIRRTLGRGDVVSAALFIGKPLVPGLKVHSGQRVAASEIGGANPHEKSAVYEFSAPRPVAHAVGD
ncbi:hypothetical protein SDC9_140015 [bioreactor metagenome]|uniref:Uncharacterized protein n=1 Tax=bioreactor metagenome TaxID=1076179 RepID=A0A645DUB6_9ZZZZ